ncbi:AAA family ATPase [Nonomuraea sp. LPB2021202275-12-8]|uniref:AAA family ATPase n=1 Tax=Nonomuraea sp. LPB2021202275-12-8 TaxID=3120159 RepID=UPI00300C551E
MLLRFRVANHRSIRDEQTLSLVAVPRRGESGELGTVRVAGIYGANASGKSNVLSALMWMISAIRSSHTQWEPVGGVPRQPFKLSEAGRTAASFFELDFLHEEQRYSYGFEVDDTHVLGEWLYAFPHGRKKKLFERSGVDDITFGRALTGENQRIRRLTRPNSLYLSAAASNNHHLLGALYAALIGKVMFAQHGEEDEKLRLHLTKFLLNETDFAPALNKLLQLADLGVERAEIMERPNDPMLDEFAGPSPDDLADSSSEAALRALRARVVLRRSSGGVSLSLEEESAGTRAWLSLLGHALLSLRGDGVLVTDEIDSSLHPLLSSSLIRMFKDPLINKRRAQLIFASHDTTLLGSMLEDEIMARDEVWFTEKDDSGSTSLYSLAEFHPRRDENVERGYLQGRYGAVPYLNFDSIREVFREGSGATSEPQA